MKLYHAAGSSTSQKVRLTLAEKNIPYESVLLDLAKKENLSPDYLKINQHGLVPTLLGPDGIVRESTVIMEYLDEIFPEPALKPATALGRAEMRLWTKLADEALHDANTSVLWPILVLPAWTDKSEAEKIAIADMAPDPKRRAKQRRFAIQGLNAPDFQEGLGIYRNLFQALHKTLRHTPYVIGDNFTLADIAVLPFVNAIILLGFDGLFEKDRAAVQPWFDRCTQRPSFAAAISNWLPEAAATHIRRLGQQALPIAQAALA